MVEKAVGFNFSALVGAIRQVNQDLTAQAGRAVNISLMLRNWLIGSYIAEYEQSGEDRAAYGEKLFAELAKELRAYEITNARRRQLYHYLAFYRTYPQIVRTVSAQFSVPSETLLNGLSCSHFEALIALDDDLKRALYQTECIRGNWSVRELKRQISNLYYERSGLSKDKKKLAELALATCRKNITER